MVVLDACVLIALADPTHTHHEQALDVAATAHPLAVTTLTLGEYLVKPAQLGRDVNVEEKRLLAGLRLSVLTDSQLGRTSSWPAGLAHVRAKTGLKMPDAVVLAAALAINGQVTTFDKSLAIAATTYGVLYPNSTPVS
ncbi:MAG: type II toxin-antitoxin system VapC family toxin [Promicromonosporaceae bacterium]|nr:type II toxin-antitoxin system VapC family toxin [Promicromonosporaceae bacterium]